MSEIEELTEMINAAPQDTISSVLQSIPFENLIGVPLTACVKAQEMAAEATWKYIKEVGFTPADGDRQQEAIIISFLFQMDGLVRKLSMPLLTLVPVPYISINTVDLAFQADMSASSQGELLAKYSTNKDSKIQSKYNIQNVVDINIRATSCHMPAGIAKMLDLFANNCIRVREHEKEIKQDDTEEKDDVEILDDKKKTLIASVVKDVKESAVKKEKIPTYNIELTEKLTDKNKGEIVGIIMKATGLTEKEILSRANSKNMTIITDVPLEQAEEIVQAIEKAGGKAQYK